MNINIDNYEEYFLLFADNELSEQEKGMVEDFVSQHPGLEEEFMVIKQAVFTPENELKLEDKSSLFRHTKKIINHNNFQEVFVLYIDNELSDKERTETEVFLADNPSLTAEFELFQKIKFQPDKTVVFPNKKLLLKKEDPGKVVTFKWWKAVAAAVLLGIGTWIGLDFNKTARIEVPPTAKTSSTPQKQVNPVPGDTVSNKQLDVAKQVVSTTPSLKQKIPAQDHTTRADIKPLHLKKYPIMKNQPVEPGLPAENEMIKNRTNELPDMIAKELQKNNSSTVNEDLETGNTGNGRELQDEIVASDKDAVPGVVSASYTKDDAVNEAVNNNNYAFYNIPEEKFNKSKVGVFIRKVKRVIERKISPLNSSKNEREMPVN